MHAWTDRRHSETKAKREIGRQAVDTGRLAERKSRFDFQQFRAEAKEGSAWESGPSRSRILSRGLLRCRSTGAGASEFGRCLFGMHNPKM